MTIKLYTSTELSNERYHSDEFPQTSGTQLFAIHERCPKAWKFGEKKESAAMAFGTMSHVMMLENSEFEKRYARGLDINDYPDDLNTNPQLEKWLKDRGIKCGGLTKAGLVDAIKKTGEDVGIWSERVKAHSEMFADKIIVPPSDFDTVYKMREALFEHDLQHQMYFFVRADNEVSLIGDEFKCRIDKVAGGCFIIDYKTTRSVSPEFFGAEALKRGYWLKMALQADLFEAFYNIKPTVILYAQEKTPPYLCKPYRVTDEQLEVGRAQYQNAYKLLKECEASGKWTDYGGLDDLPTPAWAEREYGFSEFEIVDEDGDSHE